MLYCCHLSCLSSGIEKSTLLLDTSANARHWLGSMKDISNTHFIAGNSPLRTSQQAERVVIGSLLTEKRENYRSEMTWGQSSKEQLVYLSLRTFFRSVWGGGGGTEIADWISITSHRFHQDGTKKKQQPERRGQEGIFVTKHTQQSEIKTKCWPRDRFYSHWFPALCSHTCSHFYHRLAEVLQRCRVFFFIVWKRQYLDRAVKHRLLKIKIKVKKEILWRQEPYFRWQCAHQVMDVS